MIALRAHVLRWLLIIPPLAIAIGSAVAFFLWALDAVTAVRLAQPWLLYLLPLAGACVALVYHRWGKGSDAGNNLILEQIHEPSAGVPGRLAPFVLFATIVTHLFGGSAGREGTAVQIGGSFASAMERRVLAMLPEWMRVSNAQRGYLLQAGMAAGFGAVFGTPLAGAIFALEVLSSSALSVRAFVPCMIGSFVADFTVRAWGVQHTLYPHLLLQSLSPTRTDPRLIGKVVIASVLFGLASRLFAGSAHTVQAMLKKFVRTPWLRPVVGGAVVIALTFIVGSRDYLGLGVSAPPGGVSILSSFAHGGATPFSWFNKLVFTVVTVGSGFKGGEVTPLFFIGATLGNTLSVLMHAPVALFAALGFVAVFAGATNTPLACAIMGLELFGVDAALYFALSCFVAYLCSSHKGIYTAQRQGASKLGVTFPFNAKHPA